MVVPVGLTESILALDDDAITNGLVFPSIPRTDSVAVGVPVPIPSLVLVLSQKKLELFCETSPFAPRKATDPWVNPVKYVLPDTVRADDEALVVKTEVRYPVAAVSPPVVEALPCIYREATVVEERVEVARVVAPVTERVPVA